MYPLGRILALFILYFQSTVYSVDLSEGKKEESKCRGSEG